MDNIILIGMPGSGKSTVGAALAGALGYDFLDGDLVIQAREGASLQQLLDQRGLEAFLDLERDALLSIQCRHAVIAPGGSCVYRAAAMEHLRALGTVVYLSLPLAAVERRLHDLDSRGVALGPGQTLADLYDLRVPLYERYAHITVSADGQSPADTVEAVKQALNGAHGPTSGK